MIDPTKEAIIRIALPVPLRRNFDYLLPTSLGQKITPGMRVKVPFQARKLIGMVVETDVSTEVPLNKLKKVIEVLDHEPILTREIFKLCLWAAEYYHAPLGEVLWSAIPTPLRKGKAVPNPTLTGTEAGLASAVTLTSGQKTAIDSILSAPNSFQVTLLDGVTGSGKTEVYLQVIAEVLKQNGQVLVLVPEISLTPQTIERFQVRFSVPIVVLHSGLNDTERLTAWSAARNGSAKIVIGTRSAVFTPFARLGLIVIDEEHDPSFKQQERFRYHARDVAIVRARSLRIPVILGSATPALETIHNAQNGRYQKIAMPERAGCAAMPSFHIVDVRQKNLAQGLSPTLLTSMQQHLEAGNQVLLFLNRRGFAPVWLCRSCGSVTQCARCDTRMIYHRSAAQLHCHHCDSQKPVPEVCEQCGAQDFMPVGLGTQRIESALEKHFPGIPILRIDKDSTRRKGAIQQLLGQVHDGAAKILIGTQMLAKGHHFPAVTLVGMIDIDSGLLSADFRALERTGQLLTQVAGRSGRADKPGTVLIQTHHPDHLLLTTLINNNYTAFSEQLLLERKQASLPPFCFHALFRADAHELQDAEYFLNELKTNCINQDCIQVFGPIPATILRVAGRFRMNLLVQANNRQKLQLFLKEMLPRVEKLSSVQRVRWILDVDPVEAF